MKTPTTKNDALELLIRLDTDFNMLMDGTWVPDDDSCQASLDVISALTEWVKELKC